MEAGTNEYIAVHSWVRKILGKPLYCSQCGRNGGTSSIYDWANISKEYKYEITDWIRLCKKCHRKYDNPRGLCRRRLHILSEQQNPKIDKDGYIECRTCRNEKRREHYHKMKKDVAWYERKKELGRKASIKHYYKKKEE